MTGVQTCALPICNRKAHHSSAQLACEAAGAIRTVASLTREDDCCRLYSKSLEEPFLNSNRTALSSNLLFAISQSMSFWVIALVFWYGSLLVSGQEIDTFQFFVTLMVSVFMANEPYRLPLVLLERRVWFYSSWQRLFICSRHIFGQRCCLGNSGPLRFGAGD